MVRQILAKSGIISFSRMARILKDTFVIAKHENFDEQKLLRVMLNNCCQFIPDKQLFIAKSDMIFDSKRDQILRDLLITKLVKKNFTNAELKKDVLGVANCDFSELKPILETIAREVKGSGIFELKQFDEEVNESVQFSDEMLKKNMIGFKALESSITKAKKQDFYKSEANSKSEVPQQMPMKMQVTEAEQKTGLKSAALIVKKALDEEYVLSSLRLTTLAMTELSKVGSGIKELEQILDIFTVKKGEKYYLKNLEDDATTNTRDMLLAVMLNAADQKMKMTELRKEILKGLKVNKSDGYKTVTVTDVDLLID